MIIHDKEYGFTTTMDLSTGLYQRSPRLLTGEDAFMASFPHLLDVGIMGHCLHGLDNKCQIGCYQSGGEIFHKNMPLGDYKLIVDQCKGKVFQFALGGRGDPNLHEDFEEMLAYTRSNHIVPNYTTSGYHFTREQAMVSKKYCGAVAVSWYHEEYTKRAISLLLEAGVKTNIHFVLSKDSIEEAIYLLEHNGFPEGINRIIFLLYKPMGHAGPEALLKKDDLRVTRFLSLVELPIYSDKMGFDSCSVPGLVSHCENLDLATIEACEGGRYSAYIDANLNFMPCSFDRNNKWAVSLKEATLEEAWKGAIFTDFRNHLAQSCPSCSKRPHCLGPCPILPEISLCQDMEEYR